MIHFTKHALEKFLVLRRHGIVISKVMVVRAVVSPEAVDHARTPLLIARPVLTRRAFCA